MGCKKITKEEFVARSIKIYGDKYDYSLVEMDGMHKKVIIICKKHGEFLCTPGNHRKHGCPKCNGGIKQTQEHFLIKANEIHGNKYDYSKVKYISASKKVIIICSIHGEFFQTPNGHLDGKGCAKCAGKYRTTEEFIEKSKKVHGDKYDYSKINYNKSHDLLDIGCPHHGYFKQSAMSHMKGFGCAKCSFHERYTNEIFIEKANKIHNYKYDYSKINYININTKINIICSIHGIFSQTPSQHLDGNGCAECGYIVTAMKTVERSLNKFEMKSREVHGDKYDYSKVEYKHARKKVIIICPDHGEFLQRPNEHLCGSGCPNCSHVISKPANLWLTSLGIPDDIEHREVRIKLPNMRFGYKVDGYDPETKTIYEFYGDYWHGNPQKFNQNEYFSSTLTFGDLYNKTMLKEQDLRNAGYTVISIWEEQWNNQNLLVA